MALFVSLAHVASLSLGREVLSPTGTERLTKTCSRSWCPLYFVSGHKIESTFCFAFHAEQSKGIAVVVGVSGWLVAQLKSGKNPI